MNKYLSLSKDIKNIIGKYTLPIKNISKEKLHNHLKNFTFPIYVSLNKNIIFNENEVNGIECYNFDKHLILKGQIYWTII